MRKLRTRFPRSGVKLCYGGSTLLTTIGWKIANLKYIKCQIDTQMVRDLSTKQNTARFKSGSILTLTVIGSVETVNSYFL